MSYADAHQRMHQLLDFFEYEHLPPHLQDVSKPFGELAKALTSNGTYPDEELLAGLRKLLEAKDCCVRSTLMKVKEGERHSRLVKARERGEDLTSGMSGTAPGESDF